MLLIDTNTLSLPVFALVTYRNGTPVSRLQCRSRIPDLSLLKTDLNPLEAAAQMKVEAVSKMQSSVEPMTATKVESEVEKSVMATVGEAAVVDNVTPQL